MNPIFILTLSVIFAIALVHFIRAVKIGNFISDYALHDLTKIGMIIYFEYLLSPILTVLYLVYACRSETTIETVSCTAAAVIAILLATYLYKAQDVFKWNDYSLKQFHMLIGDVFELRYTTPEGNISGFSSYTQKKFKTLQTYHLFRAMQYQIEELFYTFPELTQNSRKRQDAIRQLMLSEYARQSQQETVETEEI